MAVLEPPIHLYQQFNTIQLLGAPDMKFPYILMGRYKLLSYKIFSKRWIDK